MRSAPRFANPSSPMDGRNRTFRASRRRVAVGLSAFGASLTQSRTDYDVHTHRTRQGRNGGLPNSKLRPQEARQHHRLSRSLPSRRLREGNLPATGRRAAHRVFRLQQSDRGNSSGTLIMALTKLDLEAGLAAGCTIPNCKHAHGPMDKLFFHGQCHPHARVDASYKKGSGPRANRVRALPTADRRNRRGRFRSARRPFARLRRVRLSPRDDTGQAVQLRLRSTSPVISSCENSHVRLRISLAFRGFFGTREKVNFASKSIAVKTPLQTLALGKESQLNVFGTLRALHEH